jgi:hypothetical protein
MIVPPGGKCAAMIESISGCATTARRAQPGSRVTFGSGQRPSQKMSTIEWVSWCTS